tara:strand:+ start:11378 stop:12100 length:723 start_codon:yes stop_codon:yes gene_type:complete
MRSGNPTLNDKMFQATRVGPGQEVMTASGAYMKTAILLALCISAASFTWSEGGMGFAMIGFIGGLVFALITIFKKEWATITAPLYAICEGVALGGISFAYQAQYPGIVLNAIMLTFAVMAMMLYLYSSGIIKVTDKLKKGIFAATGAIFLVYMVGFVMSFFGSSIPMIHGAGMIGIGFSLLVVGIASFNLLLDFDFIERASATRSAPKYMEWFAAFGLMVTLVWLYLEILRLLSKLNSRR